MKDFYMELKKAFGKGQVITLTGLDGQMCGEKAIFHNGKLVYGNETSGWERYLPKLPENGRDSGVTETESGRIYYEVVKNEKKLVICGGGHVANAVIAMAKLLEFPVTVIEDREEFAREAVRVGADEAVCADFTEGLSRTELGRDVYVLVMTRGHGHDKDCLKYLLTREYGYLGMLGSRKRVGSLKEELKKEGYDREKLDGIYSPVGLPIHAQTPAEIAVSIFAEIISVRNKSSGAATYGKEVKEYLFSDRHPEGKERAVLATIIKKQGSAPRDVGTKMLIFGDGSICGTIGGGYLEAVVMKEAEKVFTQGQAGVFTKTVVISSDKAAEEGMRCGGTVEVMLEM